MICIDLQKQFFGGVYVSSNERQSRAGHDFSLCLLTSVAADGPPRAVRLIAQTTSSFWQCGEHNRSKQLVIGNKVRIRLACQL